MRTDFRVISKGHLSHDAFDRYAVENVFRPRTTSSEPDASARLGWEVVPGVDVRTFAFVGVDGVTAEGVAVLAATIGAIRSAGFDAILEGDVLRVPGFTHTGASSELPESFVDLGWNGGLIFPATRVHLTDLNDCWRIARHLAAALASVSIAGFSGDTVAEAAELSLREIFANIFTHSYTRDAFLCATIQKPHGVAPTSPREREWLEAHVGLPLVELAISDAGCGVPAHLANQFSLRYPKLWQKFNRTIVRTKEFWQQRSNIHDHICRWAFAHDSTSRTLEDTEPRATLNWRGLHRAFSYVAWHNGTISMRSGQARVALVASDDLVATSELVSSTRAEYPGTTVVLRFGPTQSQVRRRRANDPTPLSLAAAIAWPTSNAEVESFAQKVAAAAITDPSQECAIVYSDMRSSHTVNDAASVENVLHAIPAHVVSVHVFSAIADAALSSLLAATPDWTPDAGVPRLLCCWDPQSGTRWTFAGVAPLAAVEALRALASGGATSPPSSEEARSFLQDLQLHYPHRLRMTESVWELVGFDADPDIQFLQSALRVLLSQRSLGALGAVYDASESGGVRLSTRSLVRRYASATALVSTNETIRLAASRLLELELRRLSSEIGEFILYPANLASYYLLRILTRGVANTGMRVARTSDTWFGGPVVVFTHAVHTGETLEKAIARLRQIHVKVRRAIAVLDIRDDTAGAPLLTALMSARFDPIPLESLNDVSAERAVCAVTDWPVELRPEAATLSYFPGAANLLELDGSALRYGLQVVDGRIHVVTLAVRRLMEKAFPSIIDWIIESTTGAIEALHADVQQLVLFVRRESTVYEYVGSIAAAIRERTGVRSVLLVTLPAVPRGRRVIYAVSGSAIFDTVIDMGAPSMFERPSVKDGYVAAYLDSAAVTGGTLRAFVDAVTSGPQEPVTIIALPVVNRLSPSEESFICLAQAMRYRRRQQNREALTVPFTFRPLFRLQVRSFEHIAQTGFNHMVAELIDAQLDFNLDVAAYVQLLDQRRRNLQLDVRSPELKNDANSEPMSHPFAELDATLGSLALRLVEFRQLLALHHQNQGVLPILLQRFNELFEERQYELLTLFAVEPELLDEPPMALECWDDLITLASECVRYAANPSIVSDALVVLARDGHAFANVLIDIVRAVKREYAALYKQSLAFTGLVLTRGPSVVTLFRRALGSIADGSLQDTVARFDAFVKSVATLSALALPSAADAVDPVYKLCSVMYRHSPAYYIWRDAAQFLGGVPSSEPIIGWDRTVESAVALAKQYLVPALLGVGALARDAGNVEAEREARFAARRAVAAIHSLEVECARNPRKYVDMRSHFETLRASTLAQTPDNFMGSFDATEHFNARILEKYMPDVLCAPLNTISAQLAKIRLPRAADDLSLPDGYIVLEPDFAPEYLILVRGQQSALLELVVILYENYLTHGQAESLRVGFVLGNDGDLTIVFVNRRRRIEEENPGDGRGLTRARSTAELAGGAILVDENDLETFSVYVIFVEPIQIQFGPAAI